MLCTYCGATTSPALDRCVVCHTPYPTAGSDPGTAPGTDPDADQTRLAPSAPPTAPPVPTNVGAGGVPLLQAGQTFANRYTIIRLLGAGGMAAVYQAWDETLGSAVALKLIRIDPSMQPADIRQLEDRFKRELKLARQVTHANVVRIHDLGEVGSTLYLTMAYVQGSDLSTVMRQGRIPIARALALARQIVSGLSAAHKAGVVHRDLKPANIMVDADDTALLTDFGIARSTTGMTVHTMPGAIIGTLEYMAPEQARGEAADQRTDIYAFGLILYELLAGGRPRGTREGGLSDLIQRLEQGPPPIRTVNADVPADAERIVSKCLKANPAERYATADELLADLEALDSEGRLRVGARRMPRWKPAVAAGVIGGLLVTGTWWIASNRAPAAPAAIRKPVPVLIVDFANRAQEPVFDGALEQALSIAMEGDPYVTAYPRAEAASLVRNLKLGEKLDENTGRLVANREGIPLVLAGSIERDGSGYRVAVRAVDPARSDGDRAHADARAADKAAVLGAVGQVAERLRRALGGTTASAEQQAETFTAGSLDAIREYTIAQDLTANQKDEQAVVHYQRAIEHDRDFGRAYAGLATSLHYLGRRKEADAQWEEALKRIDRMSEREKLRTMGLYFAIANNFEKAIDEYNKLVGSFPADSAGHNNLAVAHFNTLNFTKALEHGKLAIDIYPKSFKFRSNYALYAMYAGDFQKASTTAKALIAEDPTFDTAYLPLAMAALAEGDTGRAAAAYEQAGKTGDTGASLAAGGLADIAIYQGLFDRAANDLPPAIARDNEQKNSFGAVAKLLALGEAHAARGQTGPSQTALASARTLADDDSVLVTTARLAVAGGRLDQARGIAAELEKRRPPRSRAYGKLIEAEIATAGRRFPEAIDALNAAQKLANLWLVRYALGHAYFQSGDYQAALSEFDECRRRRGEATAVFLDDLPTFRYYATVPYWLGRSRQMRGLDARPQFEEFLKIRGAARDPLVEDARRRLSGDAQPAR